MRRRITGWVVNRHRAAGHEVPPTTSTCRRLIWASLAALGGFTEWVNQMFREIFGANARNR